MAYKQIVEIEGGKVVDMTGDKSHQAYDDSRISKCQQITQDTSTPVAETKKSINNMVQVFRALAIVAVVMIHTTPLGNWQVFCRPFIIFSVATFLFLSGYLTKVDNDNWWAFYKYYSEECVKWFHSILQNHPLPIKFCNCSVDKPLLLLYRSKRMWRES